MFRLALLLTRTWDSASTTRHLSGLSAPIRRSQTTCSSLKCTPSLIPCAATPVLRTCSTASGLTRLGSPYPWGWRNLLLIAGGLGATRKSLLLLTGVGSMYFTQPVEKVGGNQTSPEYNVSVAPQRYAGVAELADARALEARGCKSVRVQIPSPALLSRRQSKCFGGNMARVALFVDGANMFYAQRDNGWHIDFRLVHEYFFQNREKAAAYYFTASPSAGDQARVDKYRRFRSALIHLGYSVVDKEVRVITDASSEQVKIKGNLDIELVFRMLVEEKAYDEVVLMGGDSDYIEILKHLRNLGKVVVVVG